MKDMAPEERATKITEWMKKNLSLPMNRARKYSDINLKYAQMNGNHQKELRYPQVKMKS